MEFIICNRAVAHHILPEQPYIRLSLIDPRGVDMEVKENKFCLGALQIRIDDIDVGQPGCVLFNDMQAKRIINFMEFNKYMADVVVINCEAGLSRSAGAAAALSLIYNGTDVPIIEKKPMYNRFVYRTILNEFQKKKENVDKSK